MDHYIKKKILFLMLIGTSALKSLTTNVLLKFPLETHNFTSFYCKELLKKMQISIFEKYIPLHGLQRNNADQSVLVPHMIPPSRTAHRPGRLRSPSDPPARAPSVPAPLPPCPRSHTAAPKGQATKSSSPVVLCATG